MRIDCLHGYFKFYETRPGQLSRFMSLFGLEIERSGDHFTFKDLKNAPWYSVEGSDYLGAQAVATYGGPPWEVMRSNLLVYNFSAGLVVSRDSISQRVNILKAGNVIISSGMIIPGSLMEDGTRVTDYSAHYLEDAGQFRYSEVFSE